MENKKYIKRIEFDGYDDENVYLLNKEQWKEFVETFDGKEDAVYEDCEYTDTKEKYNFLVIESNNFRLTNELLDICEKGHTLENNITSNSWDNNVPSYDEYYFTITDLTPANIDKEIAEQNEKIKDIEDKIKLLESQKEQ